MAMEVHGALGDDMDRFIKECVHLFHDRQSGGHLSLSLCIQFFKQVVSIALQRALASTIERKIALAMLWQVMFVLDLPFLLNLTICMLTTLVKLWVR
jgi:hypothetical protein